MRNRRRSGAWLPLLLPLALVAAVSGQQAATPGSQPIQGPDIEEFLRRARIVTMKTIATGVTVPRKATLELDGTTRYAVFKTIDVQKQGATPLSGGKVDLDFQDSWRTEIAAYELDKLIGLGMVPATVERRNGTEVGSLQLWVDTQMTKEGDQLTETIRLRQKIEPPDVEAWNYAMHKIRLWDQLIYNTDRNVGNVLISPDWRPILIDHSRTFRRFAEIASPRNLTRFSRSMLEAIGKLDEPTCKQHLSPYLTGYQINGLLKRRDKILDLAKKAVAERGEAAVLFP